MPPTELHDIGSITIPARLLTDFIGNLPPEVVHLELNKRTLSLSIRCGKYEANIKGIDAADFPVIPDFDALVEGVQAHLVSDTLRKMIEFAAISASTDESRPKLTAVEVTFKDGKLSMAATDGYRLSFDRQDAKAYEFEVVGDLVKEKAETALSVLVPAKSFTEVSRQAAQGEPTLPIGLRITPARNQIIFHIHGKTDSKEPTFKRLQLASQLIDDRFPDYRAIIPKTKTTTTAVDTAALLKALRLAFLFARDNANIVRMRLCPDNAGGMGSIAISATSAEMGDNVSEIQALVEGKELEISFNAKYLIEYLSTVDQPQVQIETTESTRPGAFTIPGIPADDHIHVCMPMHPPRK